MQNQFCRKCGQVNFPNASTCTKCGNPLSQTSNNPYGTSEEPPPTMMANQQYSNSPSPPASEKKSKTKFFVIGGIVVVLLLFIGILGIAGVGALLYFSSQDEVASADNSDKKTDDETKGESDSESDGDSTDDTKTGGDDNPLSDIKFPPTSGSDENIGDSSGNAKVSNAQLMDFFLKEKSTVGKYTLKNVKTTDSRDNFPNRTAGVTAEFYKGSTKVTHDVALYDSMSSIKDDFNDHKNGARRGGGKIQTSKDTSIIYIKGSLVYLAFYNPQGGFHVMSSRNGKDILEYHNAYFGVN